MLHLGLGSAFRDVLYSQVVKMGTFSHPCQKDIVVKANIQDVPYFNAPLFLGNKEPIGKVDEIFGSIKDYWISVKLADGMQAESFEKSTEVRWLKQHYSTPLCARRSSHKFITFVVT